MSSATTRAVRSTGDTLHFFLLLVLGSAATEFVAAQEVTSGEETAGDGVENILLDAVTLISQDCSKKRAMGSKNSLSLQEEKLSIKFECRRIHDNVDLDILKGLKAFASEILEGGKSDEGLGEEQEIRHNLSMDILIQSSN